MSNNNSLDEFLNKSNSSIENEEINFKPALRTFKRKKLLISKITFLGTIAGLIYSFATPEIHRGGFQMVVEDRKKNMPSNNRQILLDNRLDQENRTQIYILRSNLLLKPVYKELKSENQDNKKYKLSPYKDWKKKLKIRFKEFSKILEVNMKDKNKDLIIDSLNKISIQYQLFSKRYREKTITKTIKYLELQKNKLEKEAFESSKELNKFTIANGLGDIDGFVELGDQKFNFGTLEIINEIIPKQKSINSSAIKSFTKKSQRYESQFNLLEEYETKFIDLSSKLKPNSKTLKDLKIKIKNLRESLKRPNEILLKFNELKNKASRDSSLLQTVNDSLELTKLEKINKQDPWELITQPRIRNKVWPNKKLIVALAFIGSLISGLLIAILKEKKEDKIYEITEIKNNVNLEYFGNLYLNNLDLNLNFILNNLNISKTDLKESSLSFVFFENKNSTDKKTINFLPPKIVKNYTNLLTAGILNKYENIILIIEAESLNYSDLQLLNDLISINRKYIKGWFSIDKN